jgi:hypothetical protein
MRNTRKKPGEDENKIEDNNSPMMELRENSKDFSTGLINLVSTSFNAQIGKRNENWQNETKTTMTLD